MSISGVDSMLNKTENIICKYCFKRLLLVLKKETDETEIFAEDAKRQGLKVIICSDNSRYASIVKRESGDKLDKLMVITDSGEAAKFCTAEGIAVAGFNPSGFVGDETRYVVDDLNQVEESYFNMVYCRAYSLPLAITKTERTYIREMTLEDIPAMRVLYDDEEVLKWVEPLYDEEEELEFSKAYIENMYTFFGYGLWLVFDKKSDKLIGRAGLSNRQINGKPCIELGYIIGKGYRRKHIGEEVCRAIIEYAKNELYMDELYVCTEKANTASAALAQCLGFVFFGANEEFDIYRKEL